MPSKAMIVEKQNQYRQALQRYALFCANANAQAGKVQNF
jgi:hypothetical protein